MDWFKENKFLSGLIGVVVVGSAALGFLLISSRGKYSDTKKKYETVATKVEQLRGRKLFPNEENLELQKKEAESFSEAVDRLHEKLLAYQRPLDRSMSDSGLQDLITKKVLDAKSRAARESVEVSDDFAFGLNRYASELPRLAAVPELHFSLEAADYLVSKLFDAGIDAVVSMERQPLAVEAAAASGADGDEDEEDAYEDEEEEELEEGEESMRKEPLVVGKSGVLVRYPFKVTFRSGSDAIERFLEHLANTPEDAFLYNVRLATLSNSAKEGPARSGRSSSRRRSSGGDAAAAAADSKVVLGSETVDTVVWVDVLRLNETGSAEEDPDGEAADSQDA